MSISKEEIEEGFREMIKLLNCPDCELEFTDFAVDWGFAWLEGRNDLLREDGLQERDGPFKIKCEMCEQRWWLNYFAKTLQRAENT